MKHHGLTFTTDPLPGDRIAVVDITRGEFTGYKVYVNGRLAAGRIRRMNPHYGSSRRDRTMWQVKNAIVYWQVRGFEVHGIGVEDTWCPGAVVIGPATVTVNRD